MIANSRMTERSHSATPRSSPSQILLRLCLIAGIAALFLIQLLVTFKGLAAPSAMEQAQIARELARGNGLNTKMIRPYALSQMMEARKPVEVTSLPSTSQAPLPSLLLAPIFKALEVHWENTAETRVYVLDRVIAALSMLFFVGSMGFTMLTAERLFDQRIANWTILTMTACQLLWDIATTSLAPMMLLFFFSAAVFLLVLMIERQVDQRKRHGLLAFGIGILAALMVFTHWTALWLLPGLVAAVALLLRPRALAILVILPVTGGLLYWCANNQALTGDFFGSAKCTVQSMLVGESDTMAQRNFSTSRPSLNPEALSRRFLSETVDQLRHLYEHLGSALPALLFFLALLHPFKRVETRHACIALGLIWLGAFAGMSLIGISGDEAREKQIHHAFIPIFSAYGLAFLFVLWARLPIGQQGGWISRQGIAAVAFVITALPLINTLPPNILFGIRARGMLVQWPPYLPERFATLKPIITQDEILVCDMPWAAAWYSDRPSLWLPRDLPQLEQLRTTATQHNKTIAGMVFTPWSTKADSLNDGVQNEYEPWSAQLYLGAGKWHGVDTMSQQLNFPFREILPLHGRFGSNGKLIIEMFFLSDRKRWELPPQ